MICGHGPAVHGEFFVPAAGIFLPHKETSWWSASSTSLVNLWCTQGSGATGEWHLPSLPQTNTLIGLNDIFVHLFYNSCDQFSFFSWFVCHSLFSCHAQAWWGWPVALYPTQPPCAPWLLSWHAAHRLFLIIWCMTCCPHVHRQLKLLHIDVVVSQRANNGCCQNISKGKFRSGSETDRSNCPKWMFGSSCYLALTVIVIEVSGRRRWGGSIGWIDPTNRMSRYQ